MQKRTNIQCLPGVKIGATRTRFPRVLSDVFAHRADGEGPNIHHVSFLLYLSCLKPKRVLRYSDRMALQVVKGVVGPLHSDTESHSTEGIRSPSLSDSDSISPYVEGDHSAQSSVHDWRYRSSEGDGSPSYLQPCVRSLLCFLRFSQQARQYVKQISSC